MKREIVMVQRRHERALGAPVQVASTAREPWLVTSQPRTIGEVFRAARVCKGGK